MNLRPEVAKYAEMMETKLRHNEDKGGWKECTDECLGEMIDISIDNLVVAITTGDKGQILSQAADIGNYAMMLADVNGALD